MNKLMTVVVLATLVGCAGLDNTSMRKEQQTSINADAERSQHEEADRQRAGEDYREQQAVEQKKIDAANGDKAATWDAACAEAAKNPTPALMVDLINSPEKFAGKAVTVSATWFAFVKAEDSMWRWDLDAASRKVYFVELCPPLQVTPKMKVAIMGAEAEAHADFYKGLKHSQAELVLYLPAVPEKDHLRIFIVQAKARS